MTSPTRSLVAATLVAASAFFTPGWAGLSASFSGRVFQADGRTPRSGAIVTLVDLAGEPQHRSRPTDADGGFSIGDASAGNYRLVVETSEGAFLASSSMQLATGNNQPVALSLRANFQEEPGFGGGSGGEMSTWLKWVIAGAVGVAALLVINEVSTTESTASDF